MPLRPPPPLAARILIAGLAVVALLWAGLLWDLSARVERERHDGERTLQGLAGLGALELRATLDLADLVLVDLREQWQVRPADFPLRVRLRQAQVERGLDADITVSDMRGRVLFAGEGTDAVAAVAAARPLAAALGSHDALAVSTPRLDKVSGQWQIDLVRLVLDAAREPVGMIVLTAPVDLVTRSFPVVYQGEGSALSLVRDDGVVVLRQIEPRDGSSVPFEGTAGTSQPVPFTVPPEVLASRSGIGERLSQVGSVNRTFAWQRLDGLPLTLIVSQPSSLLYRDVGAYRLRYLVGGAVTTLLILLGFYWLGRWASTRAEARAQMQDSLERLRAGQAELLASREELRRLAAHQTQVREEERKRMSAEVHDELGQRLTVLRMGLALLPRSMPGSDSLREETTALLAEIDQIMAQVRGLASRLRPAALDFGLASAIEGLVEEFRASLGIPIDWRHDLPAGLPLDDATATGVFRLVQEALTNVARHAGASHIEVQLHATPDRLALRVRDDGAGFDAASAARRRGFGLTGMRERATALGGQLHITSTPGQGTTLEATLPLAAAAATDAPVHA
ncbi:sensor histidine kinase [Ramlibacter sp. MAHUQ-53]|uniref:sensor histidine kinase n=1 Tax=unclassified Ramlibacter TaxID=2617605 RepID=UPI0036301CB5